MFLSYSHHVNTDSNTRFFVRTLYKNMPKIYEHTKHTEDDERRRTSILDTAQIMEIIRFSAIVHPCNIAFRVVHMELCFKYFFTCYRISFLPARVAANSIKPYNKHLISLICSVRRASYGSSFFPSLFSRPARFALGPYKEGKNSVYNLPYRPRTRLIKGYYFYEDLKNISSFENEIRKIFKNIQPRPKIRRSYIRSELTGITD